MGNPPSSKFDTVSITRRATTCKRLRREKTKRGCRMTKNQWIADGLLLAAAIIWGSAFAVVKNTLDSVPPSLMIALRFGIAALISGVILRKHLRGLTRGQVLMGLLVGVLTGLAYIVQTIGLQDTTAGKMRF